jgi:hypothetical protein
MVSQSQFYVYILARPNDKPFYVGKGCGNRVMVHDTEARSGCDCRKCQVIRDIWKKGGKVHRYIVFTTDNELEALAYERETIALHGRDNLCNQSDGGHGLSNPKEVTRLKKIESAKKAYADPELKARHAERMKKQWEDPEYRAKQKAGCIRAANSPETKKRQSISQAKRTDDKGQTKRYQDPEERRKVSERMKRYYEDSENRKAASERMKRVYENPEMRKKASEGQKKRAAMKKEDSHGEQE